MKSKITLIATFFILFLCNAQAQISIGNPNSSVEQVEDTVYKIVLQLASSDTNAHKSLMRQIANIILVEPTAKIEVVCHGPGLEILITDKSIVSKKIKEFSERGVQFYACEFAMKEKKVTKENMLPSAGYVRSGIIEIIKKQTEGWTYVKAGF